MGGEGTELGDRALAGLTLRPSRATLDAPKDSRSAMEFFDLVGNVRAMRRIKPDPVPVSMIRKVLDAGVKAASGMNTQPWAFVVVQDKAGKEFLAERYRWAMSDRFGDALAPPKDDDRSPNARTIRAVHYQIEHLHETPAIILVCGIRDWPFAVPKEKRIGHGPPNYGAVYPCVQNMLLACRALGLGATLTTMHQMFEAELHDRFAIPDKYGVVVMLPVGFPMGKFGPVGRKPASESTFFDRFGNQELTPVGLSVD